MNLEEYRRKFKKKGLEDLAIKCGTSYEYLYQLATGRGNPGLKILEKLITHSKGVLTREELRPDIYSSLEKKAANE